MKPKIVTVKQPRWHDRTVLARGWNLGEYNKIIITEVKNTDGKLRYQPKTMAREVLETYPKTFIKDRDGVSRPRYVIPLDEFETTKQAVSFQAELFKDTTEGRIYQAKIV